MKKILILSFIFLIGCNYSVNSPVVNLYSYSESTNKFQLSDEYKIEVLAEGYNEVFSSSNNTIVVTVTALETGDVESFRFATEAGIKIGSHSFDLPAINNSQVRLKGIINSTYAASTGTASLLLKEKPWIRFTISEVRR